MNTTCRIVQALAPSYGDRALSTRLSGHVATCLSCQAEIARYGKLRRHLATLAGETVAAPKPMVATVVAAITSPQPTTLVGHEPGHAAKIMAAGGAVAAAAAGAVALALWRNSRLVVR
jgi:hypothetical protein